ncbi:MAG: phosphoenolpyruvate--protein phosphotransferase [Chlamydiota bacterium]
MSNKKEKRFKGAPVSEGIVIGIPYFLTTLEETIPEFPIAISEVDGEIARYRKALFSSREDLEQLQSDLNDEGSQDAAFIIDTHIQMLDDPLIKEHVEEKIRDMQRNTEAVFRSVISDFESRFCKASDSFFQQRLIDVKDVSKRILGHLGNKKRVSFNDIPHNSVIFAKELAPSQTAAVSASRIGAFVTQTGGGNSHAALIARAKGIPYVAALDIDLLSEIICDCVIVDGLAGVVIFNPTVATLKKYQKLIVHLKTKLECLEKESSLKAITLDGVCVPLFANVNDLRELKQLEGHGAEGIGLFRSEYLLLEEPSYILSEEEQYFVYKAFVDQMSGLPIVVRVFDIGGDKNLSMFQDVFKEAHPILGCRGIRFLLRYPDLLRTQLRALLRAGESGDVRVLLPLVSDISELRSVKALIEEIKSEFAITRKVLVGCMLEVPSAVLISGALAAECDFLSIGTNDLVQYVLGVDRSDSAMNELHYPAHPSMIRLIKIAASESIKMGKNIGICGEIASNPLFIPLFLGLGICEFSCSSRYLPSIKRVICGLDIIKCQELAAKALELHTSEEIIALLQQFAGT